MVSKTLQSLDAWLAQAEDVLAEQPPRLELKPGPADPLPEGPVQLCFDLSDV